MKVLAKTGERNGEFQRVFTTLAIHPRLLKRLNVLGGLFYRGSELDERLREFVILRVAWKVQCVYEYGQHLLIAREIGLEDSLIRAATGNASPLEGRYLVVRQVVDELLENDDVSDSGWTELVGYVDERQALELLALVGFYRMLAGILRAARVVPEADLPGW